MFRIETEEFECMGSSTEDTRIAEQGPKSIQPENKIQNVKQCEHNILTKSV